MMENESGKNMIVIVAIVALLVGVAGGYFFGHSKGKRDLLTEQVAAVEADKKAAQEALAKAANPFDTTVNPFEGGYKNPFQGAGINPFKK